MRAKKENELDLLFFYFHWIFNGVLSHEVVTKTNTRRTYIGDMQLFCLVVRSSKVWEIFCALKCEGILVVH